MEQKAIPNLDNYPPGAVLPTEQAAPAINRKPQTLRKWACLEIGPIRPVRINGRLAWRVADLRALLNGEVQS
ncbi:MAG: DNA-binding protein [Gammaproteobacteria bacterium]|nr:DNA-binding protein [Gammaproteobacteria bacterium]